MYRENLGLKIMRLRKYSRGYSQRYLAHLVGVDVETIRMIEDGSMPNPPAQLILRIAEELDSFYMEFVRRNKEEKFLRALDWGENNNLDDINYLIDMCDEIKKIIILSNYRGKQV